MSAHETETRKNLEFDAYWCISTILAQITTASQALDNVDDYQANIGATLRDPATALLSTEALVPTVKAMLDQTYRLKTTAALIHENTGKLDNALTQLEALDQEEGKCETR